MIIPLITTEMRLRDEILAEELRTEMREGIIRIFSMYDAREDAEQLQDTFSTIQEVEAVYIHVSKLHLKHYKLMMEAAMNGVHVVYLMRQLEQKSAA